VRLTFGRLQAHHSGDIYAVICSYTDDERDSVPNSWIAKLSGGKWDILVQIANDIIRDFVILKDDTIVALMANQPKVLYCRGGVTFDYVLTVRAWQQPSSLVKPDFADIAVVGGRGIWILHNQNVTSIELPRDTSVIKAISFNRTICCVGSKRNFLVYCENGDVRVERIGSDTLTGICHSNGRFWVASQSGTIYALTESFEICWQHHFPVRFHDILATKNGVIWAVGEGHLIQIENETGKLASVSGVSSMCAINDLQIIATVNERELWIGPPWNGPVSSLDELSVGY